MVTGQVPAVSAERPSQEPTPSSKEGRGLDGPILAIVIVISSGIAIYVAVAQWLAPATLIALVACVIGIPVAVSAALGLKDRASKPANQRGSLVKAIFGSVLPVAVAGAIGLGAALFWQFPESRASAIGFAPTDLDAARKQLDDPSDKVAVAACLKHGVRFENPDWRHLLIRSLTVRPSVAAECMVKGDAEFVADIGQSLQRRWHQALLAEVVDQERACDTAGALARLPNDSLVRDASLLRCALAAPAEDAQQCCTSALSTLEPEAESWAARLETLGEEAPDDAVASSLVRMTFQDGAASGAQRQLAGVLKLGGTETERSVLAYVCQTVASGQAEPTRHLAATLDRDCPVDAGFIPPDPAVWGRVCEETQARIESNATGVSDALCGAAVAQMVRRAGDVAASLVRRAVEKQDQSGTVRAMAKGALLEAAEELERGEGVPRSGKEVRAMWEGDGAFGESADSEEAILKSLPGPRSKFARQRSEGFAKDRAEFDRRMKETRERLGKPEYDGPRPEVPDGKFDPE